MKLRHALALFAVLAVAACGGGAEPASEPEPAAEVETAPAAAPMDDAAALDAMTARFVEHYNLGQASMVADLYHSEAVVLPASTSVYDTREAIIAGLEGEMAASPTLDVQTADRRISGDMAVLRGSYSVDTAPEGADPASFAGSWMSLSEKVGGEWKIRMLLTNYDAEPPEGMPEPVTPAEPPPDLTDSPLAEMAGYWATHFNQGHGDMVASRYAEDGAAAFAGRPLAEGRAAIEETLNANIEQGDMPQITIHEVVAVPIGDGSVLGAGWYEMASSAGNQIGNYVLLALPDAEGNMQIQWSVSNGMPDPR